MDKFPQDQKIKNAKKKELKYSREKTPRAKFQDPSFPTSDGDRGIMRQNSSVIPRMVKAPTRTGDSISHHVGAMGNAMSKAGFKL